MRERNDSQARIEKEIAVEFLAACRIERATAESCRPPEPDVICRMGDREFYLELMRLADEGFEKQFALWLEAPYRGYGGGPVDLWRQLIPKVQQKLCKRYCPKENSSIELLVYFDNDATRDPFSEISGGLEGLREDVALGPFARIWIFSRVYGVLGVVQ